MINFCFVWEVTDSNIANRMNELDHDNLKTVGKKLNFYNIC